MRRTFFVRRASEQEATTSGAVVPAAAERIDTPGQVRVCHPGSALLPMAARPATALGFKSCLQVVSSCLKHKRLGAATDFYLPVGARVAWGCQPISRFRPVGAALVPGASSVRGRSNAAPRCAPVVRAAQNAAATTLNWPSFQPAGWSTFRFLKLAPFSVPVDRPTMAMA